MGRHRGAYDTILTDNIRKYPNKYIINTNTRQTVINAIIKLNMHSEFSRTISISNNLSYSISIVIAVKACVLLLEFSKCSCYSNN